MVDAAAVAGILLLAGYLVVWWMIERKSDSDDEGEDTE